MLENNPVNKLVLQHPLYIASKQQRNNSSEHGHVLEQTLPGFLAQQPQKCLKMHCRISQEL